MLTKISAKIDQFYAVLAAIVIVLALYSGFIFRGVFKSIGRANEIDAEVLKAPSPHLNREALNKVYKAIIEDESIPLDL